MSDQTQDQLRATAVAALEAIEAAHSGRIREETSINLSENDSDSSPAIRITSSTERFFDNDHLVAALVTESADEQGGKVILEERLFAAEGLLYHRTFHAAMPPTAAESEGEGPDPSDDTADESAALWTVIGPDLLGHRAVGLFGPLDYSWIKDTLRDPAANWHIDEIDESVTRLVMASGDEQGEIESKTSLWLENGVLFRLGTSLIMRGPDTQNRTDTSFWRMGKTVLVKRPRGEECHLTIPPLRTSVASLDLDYSARALVFELDGIEQAPEFTWYPGDEPFIPLSQGDQIRVVGEISGADFELWRAETLDGRLIIDQHPGEEIASVDRVVKLREVRSVDEPVNLQFKDEVEGYCWVPQARLAQNGVFVGTTVIVRSYRTHEGAAIARVETESGGVLFDYLVNTGLFV